jgi:hypothetical protein
MIDMSLPGISIVQDGDGNTSIRLPNYWTYGTKEKPTILPGRNGKRLQKWILAKLDRWLIAEAFGAGR